MKRTYITPQTKMTACLPLSICAASPTSGTQWGTNTGGEVDKVDDTTEPNPEPGTSRSLWGRDGIWDE